MAAGRMSPANPLKTLSIQLAMAQIVAFPAVLLVYMFAPWAVPAAMAAIGGGHFLPYAWLHRTRAYVSLGIVVSIGALALTLVLRQQAFTWVLVYMAIVYWTWAVVLYRRARALVAMDRVSPAAPGTCHATAPA